MTIKKFLLMMTLLATCGITQAQRHDDTAAAIREFDKVMAFAVQPYLYYTSTTSMQSGPGRGKRDSTLILHNSFYKVGDDLYYGNEQEELYLQDSLMIKVNHSRKTIQLNRVDVASKKKMDVLPLKSMSMQKLLRANYSIEEMPGQGDTGSIQIRSRGNGTAPQATTMSMLLQYTKQLHLPLLMELTLSIVPAGPRPTGEPLSQTLSVNFGPIGTDKERAMQMPLWKDKIGYDDHTAIFRGKGVYEGYEVIKTF